MKVSTIIATHNRCRTICATLERLGTQAGTAGADEIWVVDNASTDRTVTRRFPDVQIVRKRTNDGPCARNDVIDAARGEYLVFLDDDSTPIDSAVARSVDYLDKHPTTAIVGGRAVQPDGSTRSFAYPTVPLGGAMCVRASVKKQVRGFCRRFNRRAETLDLAMRILDAGQRVERFSDIEYRHDMPAQTPPTATAHRLDMRNHISVLNRLVPDPLRRRLAEDWIQRYTTRANAGGHRGAAIQGRAEADRWAVKEDLFNMATVSPATIESVFQFRRQADQVARWSARHRVRRVCIADYGKNLFATYCACIASRLEIVAIVDNAPCFEGQHYRDVPIEPDATGLAAAQGVILSSLNPDHVAQRLNALRRDFGGPMLGLCRPRLLDDSMIKREDEVDDRPVATLSPRLGRTVRGNARVA